MADEARAEAIRALRREHSLRRRTVEIGVEPSDRLNETAGPTLDRMLYQMEQSAHRDTLRELLDEKDKRISALEAVVEQLQARLDALERH
jgi:hypothetical protein